MNRRAFLGKAALALAAVVGAGYSGYRWPRSGATPTADADAGSDIQQFVSRPDLRPPRLSVTRPAGAGRLPRGPRNVFLAPKGYARAGPGQQGTMIARRDGQLVWFQPTLGADQVPMGFKVQSYRGDPVLTWWQGTVEDGKGEGMGVIYDSSYRQVATLRAAGELSADLHEFLLTDDDTALITAYQTVPADLSAVGGPRDGWVYQGVVQEIDVDSGSLRFEWRSLDHIGVEETLNPLGDRGSRDRPFDYLHLNSIDVCPDGDLVISARNTCAIYKLSRPGGELVWRLGGRRSDFAQTSRARFYWQHDARMLAGNRLSLFDDGSSPPREKRSRGLVLKLDLDGRRATVERRFVHPARLLADNQGSLQMLPEGGALVGWGSQPYTSLFGPTGRLLLDARLPVNDQSYRAFAGDWVGEPVAPPTVAVGPNSARGVTLYVSWNGATEVRRWRILAGSSPSALAPVVTVPLSGFETAVVVDATGPYFTAIALGAGGRALGRAVPVYSTA